MTAISTDLTDIRDFLNTIDLEGGTDELGSESAFARWLRAHHPENAPAGENVRSEDLELARQLRDALRGSAEGHHDGTVDHEACARVDEIAEGIPLALTHIDGRPTLAPRRDETPARAFLGRLLAAVARASVDGSWQRLKICRDDTCQWAFFDESRNRSRRWCSMEVCGNRNKTRSYRERHDT